MGKILRLFITMYMIQSDYKLNILNENMHQRKKTPK